MKWQSLIKYFTLDFIKILAVSLLIPISGRAEPSQYICISDSILGYKFNSATHEWEPTKFNQNDKYLVRRYKAGETDRLRSPALRPATWGIFPIGGDTAVTSCTDATEVMGPQLSGILMCDGMLGFNFNKKNLRFQAYEQGHYVVTDEPESKGREPWLEIGKCSAL